MYKVLALAAASIWLAVLALPDNNLHLVVCDVGQGDAILVSYKTTQMLVDGGPNSSVLRCLGEHMPFYDHRIEVVLLTHPQADHMNGLIDVLKRYTVLNFVRSDAENTTEGFKELMKLNEGNKVYAGDKINFEIRNSKFEFSVVWPERGFESKELNDMAIVGILEYGQFTAMLTGDADSRVEDKELATGLVKQVDVLKVPHHGSKTGMTREWLEQVRPLVAIISVGRKNGYGHPTPEVLRLLSDEGIKILRTDQNGDVEIVSDGESYWVKGIKN